MQYAECGCLLDGFQLDKLEVGVDAPGHFTTAPARGWSLRGYGRN